MFCLGITIYLPAVFEVKFSASSMSNLVLFTFDESSVDDYSPPRLRRIDYTLTSFSVTSYCYFWKSLIFTLSRSGEFVGFNADSCRLIPVIEVFLLEFIRTSGDLEIDCAV